MKQKLVLPVFAVAALFLGLSSCTELHHDEDKSVSEGKTIKINGSLTVQLLVADAAEVLRMEKGMDIQVDTKGGSQGGIAMLGEGLVDLGMSSRPLDEEDRALYPDCDFQQYHIGEDAVAIVVSRDVWKMGIRSISKKQMRGIYEGKTTNWNELGGADQRIVFLNKEPGHGTREVFVEWLYGDSHNAPSVSFSEIGGNEETRYKVGTTRGAISTLSASWADGERTFALAIKQKDGSLVEPSILAIARHKYPLTRPLYILSNGRPQGPAKDFVRFLMSENGQEIVRKNGYLALSDLVILRLGSN